MDWLLNINIPSLQKPITYSDKILLIGSCFTEHISERLTLHKFRTLANPHGILFNPLSVANALNNYVSDKKYREDDLFYLNEIWNSWDHHTRFSDRDKNAALHKINEAQVSAAHFIKDADWIILTLGSAFQYYLKEKNLPVANNHRAPAQWFEKKLLEIDVIVDALKDSIHQILTLNPRAQFLFTISPVRHIRDGVVNNNRSKSRLIEAVHSLCEQIEQAHYFPAYEIVVDILRDYRFYDIDFVHPNYAATQFVWEKFTEACIADSEKTLMKAMQEIATARSHKPRFPDTKAHRKFKDNYKAKIFSLMKEYPFLDLQQELAYFSA